MSQVIDPPEIWRQATAGIAPTDADWPEQLLHYTKFATFREIATSKEVVLFNSLNMNDRQEVAYNLAFLRWHLYMGGGLHTLLQALGVALGGNFLTSFLSHFDHLSSQDWSGTYIFCLSKHDPNHPEGRLSMWRAYGGDGAGVALGVQTKLIKAAWRQPQPIILYKVRYESETTFLQTAATALQTCLQLAGNILPIWRATPVVVLDGLYEILMIVASTRKHPGFLEEQEWRVIRSTSFASAAPYLRVDTFAVGATIRLGFRLSLTAYLQQVHANAPIDDLIGDVIVGPCEPQVPIKQAVEHLLGQMGLRNPNQHVKVCHTPYRPNK